jgi:hypothetical protein
MAEGTFWYCMNHHTVEGVEGCSNSARLGPYQTIDEARHALDKVRQRNEEWDNDPRWNDDPQT